jgi:hypothetical protein
MKLCEFCTRLRPDGECGVGLERPKRMTCRMFEPGVERFCSNSADFVSARQLLAMAAYFDIKGSELKKVRLMAEQAERGQ